MAKPMVKTPGPIDTDAIAWAVRETILASREQEPEQPASNGLRLYAVAVKLAGLVTMLAALRMFGAAMGWNA